MIKKMRDDCDRDLPKKLMAAKKLASKRERRNADEIKQKLQEKFADKDFDLDALKQKLGDKFGEMKEKLGALKQKIESGEIDKKQAIMMIKKMRDDCDLPKKLMAAKKLASNRKEE